MRSLIGVAAGVDTLAAATLAAATLAAATLVVTLPTSVEVPMVAFGDMAVVSGMAVGGVMALARAGCGQMLTAGMCGPVIKKSDPDNCDCNCLAGMSYNGYPGPLFL
jgi:hypothetical protein